MVLLAASILGNQPLIGAARWPLRVSGASGSALYLWPEILVCALLLSVASLGYWTLTGMAAGFATHSRLPGLRWVEPPLFWCFLATGIIFVYPAQLHHPAFALVGELRVITAQMLILAFVLSAAAALGLSRRRHGRDLMVSVSTAAVSIGITAVLTILPGAGGGEGFRNSILILGLDSMAQTQDLGPLEEFAARNGWNWYSRTVTPGLLTNSVWPAIIMNRPVSETGCFMIFQDPRWSRSPYHMVEAAEEAGYQTWSFFSDQFTTYVGSNGGFDVNRSGPKGWLQPGTAAIKDASMVMPVLLRLLPRIPGAKSPPNQSGTFAYDLRRELVEIATAGRPGQRLFIAGHLDYLHQPAYPGYHEMSSEQRRAVALAPVRTVRDLSIHWQYPRVDGEPFPLYSWKLGRLQRVVADVIETYDLSNPTRENRLVILSDHGPRVGMSIRNFSAPHLYNVPLLTSGIPKYEEPLSLLDVDRLIGLEDATRPGPAPLTVEYTNLSGLDEERVVMVSSAIQRTGEVKLNPFIIARFGQRMLRFSPFDDEPGYENAPVLPGEMDDLEPATPVISP